MGGAWGHRETSPRQRERVMMPAKLLPLLHRRQTREDGRNVDFDIQKMAIASSLPSRGSKHHRHGDAIKRSDACIRCCVTLVLRMIRTHFAGEASSWAEKLDPTLVTARTSPVAPPETLPWIFLNEQLGSQTRVKPCLLLHAHWLEYNVNQKLPNHLLRCSDVRSLWIL